MLFGGGTVTQTANAQTEATMQSVFAALTAAYVYGLDRDAYVDPANRRAVSDALKLLVKTTERVESHGDMPDPALGYLQGSLAGDAREALLRYQTGELAGSRFILTRMAHNCMTCHTRVASETEFELGEQFLAEANVAALSPQERVTVEIAVRQFDTAMNTYEEILADESNKPLVLNLGETFENYLRLCFGTRGDIERPAKAFRLYSQREDLSVHMKALVNGWVESLETLNLDKSEGNELDAARDLIADTQLQKRFQSDRANLVELVAAETLLHGFLQGEQIDALQTAEAYYLLAVAESNVSRSYWITEAPFLLEQAIRTAPSSPLAPDAYAFLEEYTLTAYAGMALPKVVENNLEELQGLVER